MPQTSSILRTLRRPVLAAAALAAGLAVPVCAMAATDGGGTGGYGLGGATGTTTTSTTTSTGVTNVNQQVSVQGDGITLITTESGRTGTRLVFTGSASRRNGRSLAVEFRRSGARQRWLHAATATISKGHFRATWRASASGHLSFRAVLVSNTAAPMVASSSAASAPTTPALTVTVFHTSKATWYGGKKMWGRKTACGETLHPTTLGVANRTLKCGTKVAVYYRGHEIVVPVIDRGPYAHNGASWDLTEATAKALNTLTVGLATVGTLN